MCSGFGFLVVPSSFAFSFTFLFSPFSFFVFSFFFFIFLFFIFFLFLQSFSEGLDSSFYGYFKLVIFKCETWSRRLGEREYS